MPLTGTPKAPPTSLVNIFESIDIDSCPARYNFHLHTRCSDGQLTPEQLMEQAVDLGLEALAITDHHSVEGYWAALAWLENQATHPLTKLWIGAEFTVCLAQTDVHILGYDFDASASALQPYLQGGRVEGELAAAHYVIDAIHDAQGIAVLAHPARYKKAPELLVEKAVELGIDGLETYYCYKSNGAWQPSPVPTRLVQQLAQQYDLLQTCGTDTHGTSIQQRR